MRIFTVNKEVVLNTDRFLKSYPAAGQSGQADVDTIYVEVHGETRLLKEVADALEKQRAEQAAAGVEAAVAAPLPDAGAAPAAKPLEVMVAQEEDILAWPHSPPRLGRVSSRFVGAGFHTHQEREALPDQLKTLQAQKPLQKHFRFAVVNGFGSNLGDNQIGITAFRRVARCLQAHFASFSVDILFGPDSNSANKDTVGHEPWVDQVLFQSVALIDFARYDGYFDVTDLIVLPGYDEMPTVDWYLWWFGLDPDTSAPEDKRNQGYIRWPEWQAVATLLRAVPGKRVLFNPKASVALRSMPAAVARAFAEGLLALDEGICLVVDQPLGLEHKRLLDLSAQINSPEKFKALVAQVEGLVTVNSFASHVADFCATPTVHLCACLPGSLYPYYPYTTALHPQGYETLPAYNKCKVTETEWETMASAYETAWASITPAAVWEALSAQMARRQAASGEPAGLTVTHALPRPTFMDTARRPTGLKRLRVLPEVQQAQARIPEIARSVLKPGTTCVMAGVGVPDAALALADRVTAQGRLIVFEPRQVLAQVLDAALLESGFFGFAVRRELPMLTNGKVSFPDLDPWSEVVASEWGNVQRKVFVTHAPIDALDLALCHCLVVQPPMPFAAVLEGALQTLKKCRPMVLLGPIPQTDITAVCAVLHAAAYKIWAEPALPGASLDVMQMLALPTEQESSIEGFVSIEVNG